MSAEIVAPGEYRAGAQIVALGDALESSLAFEGFVPDLDEVVYHAHSALSSTGARQLLQAPARFAHWMRNKPPHKKAYDVGSAVHAKVLGTGWDVVEIPDRLLSGPNRAISSVAAKWWVEMARASNAIPLKAHEIAEVDAMAESVLANAMARVMFEQEGDAELSVFSRDAETGIEQRCRFDYLGTGSGRRFAVDLKTKHGLATPVKFSKTVAELGYHVQVGHYLDTLAAAGGEVDQFVFVVVEKEPPYLTATYVLGREYLEMGYAGAAEARRRFAAGIESGDWPGYPQELQIAIPPNWAVYDHNEGLGVLTA